jgi:hypothetical protein
MAQPQATPEQRIPGLLASAPVMLFMKGAPDAPRCGFSRKTAEALAGAGIQFKHFDILQVRPPNRLTLREQSAVLSKAGRCLWSVPPVKHHEISANAACHLVGLCTCGPACYRNLPQAEPCWSVAQDKCFLSALSASQPFVARCLQPA